MPSSNTDSVLDAEALQIPAPIRPESKPPSLKIQFGENTIYLNNPGGKPPINKMNRSKASLLVAVMMLAQQVGMPQVVFKGEVNLRGSVDINLGELNILRFSSGEIKANALTDERKSLIQQSIASTAGLENFPEIPQTGKSGVPSGAIAFSELFGQLKEPARQWLRERVQNFQAFGLLNEQFIRGSALVRQRWSDIKKLPEAILSTKPLHQLAAPITPMTTEEIPARLKEMHRFLQKEVLNQSREMLLKKAVEVSKLLTSSAAALEGTFKGQTFTFRQEIEKLTISRNSDAAVVLIKEGDIVRSRLCDTELAAICESAQALTKQMQMAHQHTQDLAR